LSQTWLTTQVSGERGGAKVAQGEPKYLQRGSCPLTSRAYGKVENVKDSARSNPALAATTFLLQYQQFLDSILQVFTSL